MENVFLIILLLVLGVTIFADDDAKWQQYKANYKLQLTGAEDAKARTTYLMNLKQVEASQQPSLTRSGGQQVEQQIDENSHIPSEEWAKGNKGYIPDEEDYPDNQANTRSIVMTTNKPAPVGFHLLDWTAPTGLPNPLPTNFDWTNYGAVRPASNQGSCGCCYVFSGTAVLEGQLTLRYNNSVKLSEEYIREHLWANMSNKNGPIEACHGGSAKDVFRYASTNGLMKVTDCPFNSQNVTIEKCPTIPTELIRINVTGYMTARGEMQIQQSLLAAGPLAVGINADGFDIAPWNHMNGKVMYDGSGCKEPNNHSILLIGYGEDAVNGKYWVLKNSWGATWGANGTFRMPRGKNACGVETVGKWACIDGTCYLPKNPAFTG